MTWLAQVAAEHPVALPATLRARYGMSWAGAGQPSNPWADVYACVREAWDDPSTSLGAARLGWDYPASLVELLTLVSGAPSRQVARNVLPFDPAAADRAAHEAEVAQATAALEASLEFV